MGQNVTMDDLNNEVMLASCAMQQLPKILYAMSNMARRSRQQMQRKRVFLGGLWHSEEDIPNQKQGILKGRERRPILSKISTCDDIWKAYYFSSCPYEDEESSRPSYGLTAEKTCCKLSNTSNHTDKDSGFFRNNNKLCWERLQEGAYKLQLAPILALPNQFVTKPAIQRVLLCHLKGSLLELDIEARQILIHLHYLKMLSNIPMHKLLRGRPNEFVLPIPRRPRRASAYCPRALMAFQCVRTLPKVDSKAKWFSKKYYAGLEYCDDPSIISLVKSKPKKSGKGYLATTVPKGVEFLTYPDSMDETSFEGTIGGRNVISWEKGTKFPQMGVDQSLSFRCRKELSRQHMIHSRLRAAKFQRRMTFTVEPIKPRPSFRYSSNFKRFFPSSLLRRKPTVAQPVCSSWFKLFKIRKSLRFISKRNLVSSCTVIRDGDEMLKCPNVDDTTHRMNKRRNAAERAERRKRLKLCIMSVLKYLSCGIVPYILTGECKIFKRKRRIRTIDSRENCHNETTASPPDESQLLTPPTV